LPIITSLSFFMSFSAVARQIVRNKKRRPRYVSSEDAFVLVPFSREARPSTLKVRLYVC